MAPKEGWEIIFAEAIRPDDQNLAFSCIVLFFQMWDQHVYI
jgi:hypothetical protein